MRIVSGGTSSELYGGRFTHPGGQKLLVLEGRGRVGMPDGETELGPGDYVDAPADERHYHGAAAGHDCTFLAITWGTTDWEDLAP